MSEVPDFWRTEVFHPLSVHFPIAFLLTALAFKLISLRSSKETWHSGGTILLLLGTIGIWIAIYTGDLADGIVSRKICDPTVLKTHQNYSYPTAILFTVALALDLLFRYFFSKKSLIYLAILVMIVGTGFLIYVSHLGANLVYQQGAGVYFPSEDCKGFE